MSKAIYSLQQIATLINAKLVGDADHKITGVSTLEAATSEQISFLANPIYRKYLTTCNAGAVIVTPSDADLCQTATLIVDNPYAAFAKVASLFAYKPAVKPGIHKTAVIGEGCTISPTASIGPYCVIGDGVEIGEQVVIEAHASIGDEVLIGDDTHFYPHVTAYHQVIIGRRVIVHSGAILGSDGFGFALAEGKWENVPQLGSLRIADDVNIGANTTIDRGTLQDTQIETGVKIDNLVQIAHNVRVGAHTVIAGCVGIAGSTQIGRYCAIGGASGIGGHLTIVDQVQLTGMSMVTGSLMEAGVYSSGTGIDKNLHWRKNAARFRQLDKIARKLQKIEQTLELSGLIKTQE